MNDTLIAKIKYYEWCTLVHCGIYR